MWDEKGSERLQRQIAVGEEQLCLRDLVAFPGHKETGNVDSRERGSNGGLGRQPRRKVLLSGLIGVVSWKRPLSLVVLNIIAQTVLTALSIL
ncbi:hypothetical protein E5288_WYG022745 [Bos mutus]|uniref:Uncharacterized protein n=1 Tax=Bos mutus TaxID=72004 RepID=A0A6B0R1S9_9CETA|nr:hypothetical protein [Bos mutus]